MFHFVLLLGTFVSLVTGSLFCGLDKKNNALNDAITLRKNGGNCRVVWCFFLGWSLRATPFILHICFLLLWKYWFMYRWIASDSYNQKFIKSIYLQSSPENCMWSYCFQHNKYILRFWCIETNCDTILSYRFEVKSSRRSISFSTLFFTLPQTALWH